MKTKFKVLNAGMHAPFERTPYKLGKTYKCERFYTKEYYDYSRGYYDYEKSPMPRTCGHYATDIEGLPYSYGFGRRVFECEVWGQEVVVDRYKQRYEFIKLIREISQDELRELAQQAEPKLGYKLSEVLFPFDPLTGDPKVVDESIIKLVDEAIRIYEFTKYQRGEFMYNSIIGSIGLKVGENTCRTTVRQAIGTIRNFINASDDSLHHEDIAIYARTSILGYITSLFPNVRKWKGINHVPGDNPFQPFVELWRAGFLLNPACKWGTFKLHSGANAEIVYEINKGN